ncbi:predicted protein [Sclerotinia sclerotiorum 1980 UF-70]|uniref:Flavin-nucleotide-binding protein n=1 Tax=Sclerotinia sclerotiorum (strain ATCC 18683 / 1980 / Ss-1) TaxID=665079 RepID=A7F7D3_SCLS1|nr:predicted protein [Sclerotinia sclerotiorum 1980 UF-70]EDN98654.1 predicted protein [Sclerotinia sclerotiorum 1980 UF-70]
MSDSEISTYPKTPRNTVQRYRNLAKYDHHTIHINTPSPSDPFPALLPMIGFAGKYNPQNPDEEDIGEGANIYIHGYVSSRLMRMGKNAGEGEGGENNNVDNDDGEEKGLPMTVAATCLDGLVLALAPFNHNYNYRSAVIQGYGQVVEDWAMKKITNTVHPTRWENSRNPPPKNRNDHNPSTSSASTPTPDPPNSRRGGPPESKSDLKDLPLRERVWTGIIPVHLQYGTPIAAEQCKVSEVPGYIINFVQERNKEGGEFAVRMAGEGEEGE